MKKYHIDKFFTRVTTSVSNYIHVCNDDKNPIIKNIEIHIFKDENPLIKNIESDLGSCVNVQIQIENETQKIMERFDNVPKTYSTLMGREAIFELTNSESIILFFKIIQEVDPLPLGALSEIMNFLDVDFRELIHKNEIVELKDESNDQSNDSKLLRLLKTINTQKNKQSKSAIFEISQYINARLNEVTLPDRDVTLDTPPLRFYSEKKKKELIKHFQEEYKIIIEAQKKGLLNNLEDISNSFAEICTKLVESYNIGKNIFRDVLTKKLFSNIKQPSSAPDTKQEKHPFYEIYNAAKERDIIKLNQTLAEVSIDVYYGKEDQTPASKLLAEGDDEAFNFLKPFNPSKYSIAYGLAQRKNQKYSDEFLFGDLDKIPYKMSSEFKGVIYGLVKSGNNLIYKLLNTTLFVAEYVEKEFFEELAICLAQYNYSEEVHRILNKLSEQSYDCSKLLLKVIYAFAIAGNLVEVLKLIPKPEKDSFDLDDIIEEIIICLASRKNYLKIEEFLKYVESKCSKRSYLKMQRNLKANISLGLAKGGYLTPLVDSINERLPDEHFHKRSILLSKISARLGRFGYTDLAYKYFSDALICELRKHSAIEFLAAGLSFSSNDEIYKILNKLKSQYPHLILHFITEIVSRKTPKVNEELFLKTFTLLERTDKNNLCYKLLPTLTEKEDKKTLTKLLNRSLKMNALVNTYNTNNFHQLMAWTQNEIPTWILQFNSFLTKNNERKNIPSALIFLIASFLVPMSNVEWSDFTNRSSFHINYKDCKDNFFKASSNEARFYIIDHSIKDYKELFFKKLLTHNRLLPTLFNKHSKSSHQDAYCGFKSGFLIGKKLS